MLTQSYLYIVQKDLNESSQRRLQRILESKDFLAAELSSENHRKLQLVCTKETMVSSIDAQETELQF